MADTEKKPPAAAELHRTMGFAQVPHPGAQLVAGLAGTLNLEVVGGPMDGRSCRVRGSIMTIGRSEDNDLTLSLDTTISTRHARIVREGEHYWLEDLGSLNGTYLGDKRIRNRTLIGPGTLFTVGRTSLEFSPR